jgi:hypothetical protein
MTTAEGNKAVKTLINGLKSEKHRAIKHEVATYDLTSISQRNLVKLGRLLFDKTLIDDSVLSFFIYVNGDFNAARRSPNHDKPINAHAVIEHRLASLAAALASGRRSLKHGVDILTKVNQVTRALAQFTAPNNKNGSINVLA